MEGEAVRAEGTTLTREVVEVGTIVEGVETEEVGIREAVETTRVKIGTEVAVEEGEASSKIGEEGGVDLVEVNNRIWVSSRDPGKRVGSAQPRLRGRQRPVILVSDEKIRYDCNLYNRFDLSYW